MLVPLQPTTRGAAEVAVFAADTHPRVVLHLVAEGRLLRKSTRRNVGAVRDVQDTPCCQMPMICTVYHVRICLGHRTLHQHTQRVLTDNALRSTPSHEQ